jgi:hypothetical protein
MAMTTIVNKLTYLMCILKPCDSHIVPHTLARTTGTASSLLLKSSIHAIKREIHI